MQPPGHAQVGSVADEMRHPLRIGAEPSPIRAVEAHVGFRRRKTTRAATLAGRRVGVVKKRGNRLGGRIQTA